MTSKDTALVASAIAEVERMVEDIPDPQGIGASTLRLVVDAIGGRIKSEHPRFSTGQFEIDALPIFSTRQKHTILAAVKASWPYNDTVAMGVLNTVSDRQDESGFAVHEWAMKIGQQQFERILADETGVVATYFEALAADEAEDLDYDEVGPAVDRVEDAFAGVEA